MGSRLFTFGCSYTNYAWPTWSDFIGQNFEHYENWGWGGAGNYYIGSKIYECNLINKFTESDTILIMLSSPFRVDFIDKTSCFVTRGSVFSETSMKNLGNNFIENIWSIEHGIYNTWFILESIKSLLDSIGCTYKIYKAFTMDNFETTKDKKLIEVETLRIINCINRINELTYPISLQEFWDERMKKEKVYAFDDGSDSHPTIKSHYEWVKNHMSEYYNENMSNFLEEWEKIFQSSNNKRILQQTFIPWQGFHDKDLRRYRP